MNEILCNEKNFENFYRFSLKKMDQLFTHLGPKMKPYFFINIKNLKSILKSRKRERITLEPENLMIFDLILATTVVPFSGLSLILMK